MPETKEVIYECSMPTYSITTDKGIIQFYPPDVGDVQSNGMPYGEVNIMSPVVQRSAGNVTADEILAHIKASQIYTEDPEKVGVHGIWPKYLRQTKEQKQRAESELKTIFSRLDPVALRAVIASKKGKVPKDASFETLVEIAIALHMPGTKVNDDEQ